MIPHDAADREELPLAKACETRCVDPAKKWPLPLWSRLPMCDLSYKTRLSLNCSPTSAP